MNWLTTAHLVGSPADMYGLTLQTVDRYTIVTKSVMPIAHMTDKSPLIQSLALGFSLVTKNERQAQGWQMLV